MANKNTEKVEFKQPNIEFRLRERERFLRTLITNLPGAVFRSKADENFTGEFISDGCFGLTGYHADELIGENAVTTYNELIHSEDRERVFAELRRLCEKQQSLDGEQFQISYRLISRDKKSDTSANAFDLFKIQRKMGTRWKVL